MLRSELKLEKEETKIYQYIESKYPHLVDKYVSCVSKARLLIMERMVNALLREGFFENEQIESQLSSSNQLEFPVRKGILIIPISDRYSYNRFKIDENPMLIENQSPTEIVHPAFLLEVMKDVKEEQAATFTNLHGLQAELSDSVANMGLALLFQQVRTEELQNVISETESKSIFELAGVLAEQNHRFDEALFFEQLSVSGHLLHPCTKSKIGLSIDEIMDYSAEFDSSVPVYFAAIHKEIAYHNPKIKSEDIHQFWLKEYPELASEMTKVCLENNQNFDDFYIIPVHPWQKEHTMSSLYSEEIAKGQILFAETSVPVKPTLSVRTVLPEKKNFHMKLPINVQMTSAVRTISPNSIHNGPEITLILNEILKREESLNDTLAIIGEEIGVRFQSNDASEPNFRDRNKNLSYLIRKTPASFLEEREHAVVACALFNLSPVTNDLLVYEIFDQFHLRNAENTLQENLVLFFEKYMTVVLSSVIPLMTKYGIGLEAHLQNTLIVLQEYEPVKVVIRDLGGVRIDTNRLERKGFYGSYFPGSATINPDEVGMQNKVIHTVFQSHIGELTYYLAKKYGVSEQYFWDLVKQICTDIFEELGKDETIRANIESDRAAILGKTVQTKALTLMRLTDDVTDYAFIDLPNPLWS
ncbi:Siderophore synthetase component [Mesobacillus persicus]|uniref:Siderophore synthetase component n=1 Tax=Mesobacillus persicus TaxID=930146 RepID=A0A1H7Z0J2_9BACI|nr:IucA/IucC family protein [Mesobacillus persicus]SEM51098.1 Siderophore synthetase component [Mesobacillus persicus]